MPLLSPGHDRPELPADVQIGALEWSPSASIYLPLSNDGAQVTMVLVYSSFRWIAGGWSPDTDQ